MRIDDEKKPNTWGHYIQREDRAMCFGHKCSHKGCMSHDTRFRAGYTFRTLDDEKTRVNHYCRAHAEAFAKAHNLTMPE